MQEEVEKILDYIVKLVDSNVSTNIYAKNHLNLFIFPMIQGIKLLHSFSVISFRRETIDLS
uniref:Uncharacterized protein n=1 Tax=Parascaris univalens TaxID=6257 RepID=A0A915B5H1_PARUN